jgi:hypothetical protein
MRRSIKWILLIILLAVISVIAFLISLQDFQLTDNDREHPPQFIEADFIDLSKVYTISKYRSGMGHSTDDSVEKCRSLRHIYGGQNDADLGTAEDKWEKIRFEPDAQNSIDIYAPVTGMIVDLSPRRYETKQGIGQTIVIKPDKAAGYKVRMDSIFLNQNLKPLQRVKAGQKIGVVCTHCPAEIYVYYSTLKGERSISYIMALPDQIFAAYQARGLMKREDAVISREYRDAHPFTCADPKDQTSEILDHPEMHDLTSSMVILSGYNLPKDDKKETLKSTK